MTDLGLPPGRARTWAACFASVEQDLGERPLNLTQLVDDTIAAIEPHRHGYRIRCASGASIVIESGHTFDAAGLPVIEP